MARSGLGGKGVGSAEITKKLGDTVPTGQDIGGSDVHGLITPPDFVAAIQLENEDYLLLENLDFMLLENSK